MVEQKDCSINPNFSSQTPFEKQVAAIQSQFDAKAAERQQQEAKADETISELRTEHQARAFNAGLTTEEYDTLHETHTPHEVRKILDVLTANKAATIEEAKVLIDTNSIETRIDQVGSALQKPSLFRRNTSGGRILEADIRHEVWNKKRHIGKRVIGAMARRFFAKQEGK